MSKILILGDPHFGKNIEIGKIGIGSSLNSRISDQVNLLDWVLEQSIDNCVSDIIITGDVFHDPKPLPNIIALFVGWIKQCIINNIKVHIVVGNHDMLRSGSVITSPLDIINEAELENIYVYKNMDTIFIDTTAFTLMPYRDRKSFSVSSNAEAVSLIKDSLLYELSGIPNTYKKVAIGHLTLEGAIPVGDEIDDIADAMFCKLDMFDKYDYVWMGHVHKPQVLKQNPYIAHIGSMDISNFLEADQKKIIVIFDTISGKFETINIPTRNLHKLSLVVPEDIEDTTEYVLNELNKNKDLIDKSTIKVEVSLSSPAAKSINKSIVDNYLVSNGAFNVTGIYESKKIMSVKKDDKSKSINTSTDVLSAIKTFAENNIDEDIRSEYIAAATEIINSYNMGQ